MTIRDAVHWDIEFDSDEISLINTREFQRLRRIKQLGAASLIYPCAVHTRFEHVLGVCHMSQRIIEAINRADRDRIGPEDRKWIRYLALLHDIGHLPYGHTLEDERTVLTDEHDGRKRVERFLSNSGLSRVIEQIEKESKIDSFADDLVDLICLTKKGATTKKPNLRKSFRLYADIVANTICADLLDYLKRDTFFTGLQHRYDDRIISSFRVTPAGEIFIDLTDDRSARTGLLSEILHLLRLRYTLGERVYYHRTKAAASAMLSKAVELLEMHAQELCDLGDDELLFLIENPELLDLRYPRIKKDVSPQAKAAAKRIIGLLRERRLYVPVVRISRAQADEKHKIQHLTQAYYVRAAIQKRRQLEDLICKACGLDPGQVVIFCPNPDMSRKEAAVKVRFSDGGNLEVLENVPDVHNEILALKHKHESLWSLEVFIDPDKLEKGKRVAVFFESEHSDLTNDIVGYRTRGGESMSFEALIGAFKVTERHDYDEVLVLWEAANKVGKDRLYTAEDWIQRFPDKFKTDLFSHAKKKPNPAGPQ